MTDTDTTAEALIPGAIYSSSGVYLLATSSTTLRTLHGGTEVPWSPTLKLRARRGSGDWADLMCASWNSLVSKITELERRNEQLSHRYHDLGQALLEKAEEKGWCDEYEEFAADWDLPKRTKEYYVTVTFQVEARDTEAARQKCDPGSDHECEYDIVVEERY